MTDREKIITAIEKAKKQSKEYAQDCIIVPFKEADMILTLLKEQEAEWLEVDDKHDAFDCSNCGAMAGRKCLYCPGCGAKMKNGTRAMEGR